MSHDSFVTANANANADDALLLEALGEFDMSQLLDMHPVLGAPGRHSLVKGTVVGERKDGFFIDLGRKTESFLPHEEAGDLKVGDSATFFVLSIGEDEQPAELSYLRVKRWQDVETLRDTKATAIATVKSVAKSASGNDAGLNVELCGLTGFVPRSEIEVFGRLDTFIGKPLPVKVLIADQFKGRRGELVLSQALAVQEEKDAFYAELSKKVETAENPDDCVVEGVVSRVLLEKTPDRRNAGPDAPEGRKQELGVLVDLGHFVTGLVHRTECSDDRSTKPSELVSVGDRVRVDLLDVDVAGRKVKLSLKSVRQRELLRNLHEGDIVEGVVKREEPNIGYFVRLGGCIDGLVHKSELVQSGGVKESLPLESTVSVRVLRVSTDSGRPRIALSRKGIKAN